MSTSPPPVNTTSAVEAEPDAMNTARKIYGRRPSFVPLPPQDNGTTLDEWLLSYSDMVTLLLIMFVSLLLSASFDKPQAGDGSGEPRRIIEQLFQVHVASPYNDEQGYTITSTKGAEPMVAPGQGAAIAVVKDEDLERIRRRENTLTEIRQRLQTAQLDAFVSANIEGDGIRLKIPNSILFNTGTADLQGRGPDVIRALAPILSVGRYDISVEGHTDNVPIKTDRFPSNWELSAQRAAAVVRSLAESGVESERMQAVGYGESRPIMDNGEEEGRRENRRVTLMLRTP